MLLQVFPRCTLCRLLEREESIKNFGDGEKLYRARASSVFVVRMSRWARGYEEESNISCDVDRYLSSFVCMPETLGPPCKVVRERAIPATVRLLTRYTRPVILTPADTPAKKAKLEITPTKQSKLTQSESRVLRSRH